MKQKDLNFLSMCEEIMTRLEKKSSYYKCYGILENQLNRVKLLYEIISSNISENVKEGIITYARQKNGLISEMVRGVTKIALKAKAYAKINNMPELLGLVDISEEELLQQNEKDIILACESILNHAGSIQSHLIDDFNLTEEFILKVSANLIQVKQMLNIRDSLKQTDLLLAENMTENMRALRTAVDLLDDLIYGIIEDEEFICMYRDIRKKAIAD